MSVETKVAAPVAPAVELASVELTRVQDIVKLAAEHGVDALEAISSGKTVGQFAQSVLASKETVGFKAAPVGKDVGLSEKEVKDFSLLKAVQASASGDWSGAGLEREATIEAAKLAGKMVKANAFVLPADIKAASTTNNPALVETKQVSFIEGLFSGTLLSRLGTTNMFDLVGNLDIPRVTGSSSLSWVGENVSGTPSDISTDLVSLIPSTAIGIVPITHKLLTQNSYSVEQMIRADLMRSMAQGIDEAILFTGTGTNSPLALTSTAGIGASDATAGLTWQMIVDAYKTLAINDAGEGSISWLSSPTAIAKMQGILKTSGDTASNHILNTSSDDLNGFGVNQSTLVPATSLVLGNWSNLIVGTWNTPEIAVDVAGDFDNGGIKIRIMSDVGSAVKHSEAFHVISNV